MRPLLRVSLVLAALVAFQGVQACASETPDPGLNPQPLPPVDRDDTAQAPPGESTDPNKEGVGGGSTSGTSSSSSGSPAADSDAGDGGGGGDSGGDN